MKDSKKSVLDDMKKSLMEKLAGDDSKKLGSLKKVTVMSPTSEGLNSGLSKAQEFLKNKFGDSSNKESISQEDPEESLESPDEELKELGEEGSEQKDEEENEGLPKIMDEVKSLKREELMTLMQEIGDLLKTK